MTNMNAARDLLKARRFDEAVSAYKKQLQERPQEKWGNLAGLAESLMGACQYAEAIPLFEEVRPADDEWVDLGTSGTWGRTLSLSPTPIWSPAMVFST